MTPMQRPNYAALRDPKAETQLRQMLLSDTLIFLPDHHLVRRSLAKNHFPATIPMPITKTPTKLTIEIPVYNMALTNVTAIMVFLLPENFFILTHVTG